MMIDPMSDYWLRISGLIEGYSTERDQREEQVRDLEEKTEALVLELETTKNRLLDLEESHHEATSLRSELQRQQELLNDNVGDQAQGFHDNRPFYLVPLVPIGVTVGCYIIREWLL